MIWKLVYPLKKTYNLKNFFFVKLLLAAVFISINVVNSAAQLKGGKVANTAVQKTVAGDSYAIIFGISNYPGLVPLKYADKDAALFRDFLETPAGGSTKPENIFFRTNQDAKAGNFNTEAYMWLLGKKLKEGDRLYIYFSGHGDAMGEDNYFLLPYDCMPNKDASLYLNTGVIEMYRIKTLFIKPLVQKNVEVLLIVDACRTNDLPGGQQGQKNFAHSVAELKEGEIIMLSTEAGQSAIESPKIGNGHGLFTWHLIAGLSGDADNTVYGGDHDGKVSMAEITSYVSTKVRVEAKTVYKADQVPVFIANEALETIAIVDSATYANWKLAESMLQQTSGHANMVAVIKKPGERAVVQGSFSDTTLIALDNKFIAALKAGKLTGESSAEAFYNQMKEKWPDQQITYDAKYALATEFINFGQDKINLFLNGKGIVHVQRMENEFKSGTANKNMPPGITAQLDRMKTLAEMGFDKAADMMEKAVELLKSNPELLDAIYPKLNFLKAASYDKVNNISGKMYAIGLLKNAIKKDSAAAYNYLMLGHLLYDLKNDSCEFYFKKAIKLAPKWADPENDLANYYSEKKKYQLAIEHYRIAVKLDSLDALAFQNIGVLYSNENMLDSARRYFLKALAINPCDHYANSNMGSLHEGYMTTNSTKDPNFRLSENYLKKSIRCDSSFTRPYLVLARLFDKVNLKDSSLYYVNEGLRRNPNDASLYRMLGDEYFDQKDTLKSESAYKQGIQVDSFDLNSYLSLIWLYENAALSNSKIFGNQKYEYALTILYCQKALKIDPLCAYAYASLGNVDVDLELYDKAVPNYQQATKIDSTYADAFNGLGNAYYYLGEFDKSLACYQKTTSLNPKFAVGFSSTADVYYVKKDYANAVVNYQKAIDVDSTYLYAYHKLGSSYTRLRNYRKAVDVYQKALKLKPDYGLTYNALGNLYYDLKSYDTAVMYHKKAVMLAPLNAYNYNDLAASYDELNKNDEAIANYKKAIELDSTRALPYANLAAVYKKIKAFDKAIVNYQKALKIIPGNPFLYNSLGTVYRDMKDYKMEIYHYKKALEIDSTQTYHLADLGSAYISDKQYPDGIACLQKAIKIYPDDIASHYNLACGYALSNNNDMGMKYLKIALEKGFKDYDLLSQDPDIQNLRKLPEFTALVKQYFPDKVK